MRNNSERLLCNWNKESYPECDLNKANKRYEKEEQTFALNLLRFPCSLHQAKDAGTVSIHRNSTTKGNNMWASKRIGNSTCTTYYWVSVKVVHYNGWVPQLHKAICSHSCKFQLYLRALLIQTMTKRCDHNITFITLETHLYQVRASRNERQHSNEAAEPGIGVHWNTVTPFGARSYNEEQCLLQIYEVQHYQFGTGE